MIRLLVSDGTRRKDRIPDLRGLSVREAKKVAAKHGLKCTITGSGVVKTQKPRQGTRVRYDVVQLYCQNDFPARGGGAQ